MLTVNIPVKFFGLHREAVIDYINRFTDEQDKILNELKQKKKSLEKEREDLLSKLSESKICEAFEDSVILEKVPGRLVDIIALINASADEEIIFMKKEANKKLEEYNGILIRLESEFDENKKVFDSMLREVSRTLKINIDKLPGRPEKEEPLEPEPAADAVFEELTNEMPANADEKLPESPQTDYLKKRNEHIIGKIAGRDITDKDGEIIVAKGRHITNEDITLAENEGKLHELIINMELHE